MVTVKIARFNPDQPDAHAETGGWQSFRVPCLPSDRMLNLLIYIKSYLDGTLTFRRSCAHGCAARTPCASTASTGWRARC